MNPEFDIEVFYDSECPLCMREIHMLQKLDRHDLIRFTDIAGADFDDAAVGVSWDSLMKRIHGRLPDGTIIEGVDVFRHLYTAVGFGRVVSLTRLPGVSHLLDAAYSAFARNRLRLTGRCKDESCSVQAKS